MVTFFGLFLLMSLAMVYKGTIIKRDQAAKSQLKIDYHQREEALMRALVATFPSKVVACLKNDYAASNTYDWNAIFTDAIGRAAAATSLTQDAQNAIGMSGVRTADVGEDSVATVRSWITDLKGNVGQVTPGTTVYESDFTGALAGKMPPFLRPPAGLETADVTRPIVSGEKIYINQAGLGANVVNYPKYNQIPYPNIRFGYAEPGQPFVAKRNWWAFQVKYGAGPGLTKTYVLSLYEIPSQLPIEAATFAEIGKHNDGSAWGANVSITGGVYADSLKMNGAHGADRLAGRQSIEIDGPLTLNNTTITQDFDALGVREQMQAAAKSSILPIALSANSGRVVFYPIPSGTAFLNKPAGTTTKWDQYKGGAIDCKVEVEAIKMVGLVDQTPRAIRVKFLTSAGTKQTVVLERDVNWPDAAQPGGDDIPFQTELSHTGRSCLTFHPSRLNAWLVSKGGDTVVTNNSVRFAVDPTFDPLTTLPVSSPPGVNDMSIIIRRGRDLRTFTRGLSIVGPFRVYIGDDLNDMQIPVPSDPSTSSMTEFYPPMSIFAAELRVGTTAFNRPFDHKGQMGSLQSGGTAAWRPLDLKSGGDDIVHTGQIQAELTPLQSPAELPPISQLNWLVTIEEIAN
ncbi:hypothetical protein DES53_117100 [Roseimicrobium gellanilyticum]|uniref:Uncharacterized protein n=2 Tax=Roseimicrobium gellanilyticum TaxID=748857 RepID=A0A366H364_9BACT|nr:hypothetical protein DES53_117100 [Roseimicrobium gellanilyticum]